MANLRLVAIKVFDSTTIKARFTEELDPLINAANITVGSNVPGVPDAKVLAVGVIENFLVITVRPLTPFATYFVNFHSTDVFKFKSINGSFLFEDGNTNVPLIIGPEDPADPVRDFLTGYLKDNIYNIDDGTLVRDVINSQASTISRALYDIRQTKNDNYLTVNILDESKTRGTGPYDRLNEEGAYEIIRVGTKRAGSTTDTSQSFSVFPSGPITLQSIALTREELEAGTGGGTFDGLIFTAKNRFVTKLKKVAIAYQGGGSATYDISTYGYQIQEPRYDQDFASPLFTLEDTQFKLSDSILDSSFVLPKVGDSIFIDYEYKDKGRIVDETSVLVSQVLEAVREVTPPIKTQFSLAHAPVVSETDIVATIEGITFLDPSADPPFSTTHPAFLKELPFKFDSLPSRAGEYAVDYSSGTVYVYGADTADGTGDFPPVATYFYRTVFVSRLDYTYDPETSELIANPSRDLIDQAAKISFSFEEVLVPGIDFNPQIHNEVLDERIENRLVASNALETVNAPLTNVFRIYNETTGEIYKITRWNGNKVYFSSTISPRILDQTRERASFTDVNNELLISVGESSNILSTRVFAINLANNRVMAASEDVIGSSFNSSARFSRTDIFMTELYFDGQTQTVDENIDRLVVGEYMIDYTNGKIYVGVSGAQNYDLGTINYKKSTIAPQFSHVISVSEVYNSISIVGGINKKIDYSSFDEGSITPTSFNVSDERFLNGDTSLPYIVSAGTILISDDAKEVRGVFDHYDLTNNVTPTNFADGAVVSNNSIVTDPEGILKQEVLSVQTGPIVDVSFVSSGAEIFNVVSVIRVSDGADLWATPGTFSAYTINLSGVGAPLAGDVVIVTYRLGLNGGATPIVDYNRGDYFVDYSFLADEILVSYEYGDNSLDFRESDALSAGEPYFVSYKVGALRDALLKNFGTLVNLPILNNFDTSLPRERYRDALKAALQSFTKGPTIPAMKGIVSNITHIDPELQEAAFENWSLGISRLFLQGIETSGDIQLLTGKYDYGVLLSESGQTITFPVSSNLRLEEGTLETWVIPEWNGIDNDATLTFSLLKDGEVLDASSVFVGADSHHPIYDEDDKFALNRADESSPIGLPSAIFTHTGMFVYYDDTAKQWKVLAKDKLDTVDGYVYSGTITSSGEVYDVKNLPGLGEINDILRSGTSKIDFSFHIDGYDVLRPDGYTDGYIDGYSVDGYFPVDGYTAGYSYDGIRFMADNPHYLFDFAATDRTNRFSLFKDGRGYLNFHVYDKGLYGYHRYEVTTDISDWTAGQKYHVALTWRLDSSDRRDEMHLFVDGMEVPNILRYGGRPIGTSSDRFRIVKPEYVAGVVPKNAIAGNDLITTAGSAVVSSSVNDFQAQGILIGDSITINEQGFGAYNILSVSGNTLTLDASVPSIFTDARYSVNEYSVVVASEIDLSSNIAVSVLRAGDETEIPGLRATIPSYSISKDSFNQNVLTILGSTNAGDQIVVRTLGLNHRRCRDVQFVWGDTTSILRSMLPPPINLDEAKITAVLLPLVAVGPSNSVFSLGVYTATLTTTQPTNSTEGRTLAVRVASGNVNMVANPVTVTINGFTSGGPAVEILTFTAAATQTTVNKFTSITSIVVAARPIVAGRNTVSVEIKEAYPITNAEGNNIYPVIRFSYKTQTGLTLSGTIGDATVVDTAGFFVQSNVGQSLVISSPGSVAGTYTITSWVDENTITISPAPAATFSGGKYDIFNVALGRSGFQNGFFVFEQAGTVDTAYPLPQGLYEFDFSAWLEIPFDPVNNLTAHVGSDYLGENQANAILDEFRILSRRITDVRVGETLGVGEDSITTNALALRPFEPNSSTLMLMHFDSLPLVNSAAYWTSADKLFRQSATSVNSNFGQSLVITNRPLVVDNNGLLTTKSEGSIEFWVSPRYDTYNDPEERFYFDATGTVIEEVVSTTSGVVKTSGRISSVVSVRLATDVSNTGVDYFAGGTIGSDFQSINLRQALPAQQVPVKVNYIPSGLSGDRISIYKDRQGYITFEVKAGDSDFQVRQPVFWQRDTWHRVQVTYKFNRSDNQDELRLFVDGEEKGMIKFGSGILFGSGIVFGQGFEGVDNSTLTADINFSDPINQFFIGSDYFGARTANARFDNLRLSDIARRPLNVSGQPKDINFSTNIDVVYPVITDVFTTYLLDFDSILQKVDDFALLRDEQFGIFDFTLNIIDSFGIVSSNAKIKQVLESLINALKPANSRVTINYIQ